MGISERDDDHWEVEECESIGWWGHSLTKNRLNRGLKRCRSLCQREREMPCAQWNLLGGGDAIKQMN